MTGNRPNWYIDGGRVREWVLVCEDAALFREYLNLPHADFDMKIVIHSEQPMPGELVVVVCPGERGRRLGEIRRVDWLSESHWLVGFNLE